MKKTSASILAIGLLLTLPLAGQYTGESGYFERGTVLEGLQMESNILEENVGYAIYLPPGYDKTTRSYPVVYLLHGYSDDESAWIQFGEVHRTADRAIADRKIPPMIIVMPDAKVTWYINDAAGKNRYEDMIFEEFIPFVDDKYRTRPDKEFRGVAGLSMGGYGTLIWALHHPDMFSACAAFSAGVMTDEEVMKMSERRFEGWFRDIYGVKGNDRLTDHWKGNSVMSLMAELPVEQIEQVRFYIDCGDDDFLFRGNSSLHILMNERGIDHEYRVRDGAHTWSYWRNNIIFGLEFIGKSFSR